LNARGERTHPRQHGMGADAPSTPLPAGLHDELERFKQDLRAGGLRESTIHSYLSGATLFVRWLGGEYQPGGSRPRS